MKNKILVLALGIILSLSFVRLGLAAEESKNSTREEMFSFTTLQESRVETGTLNELQERFTEKGATLDKETEQGSISESIETESVQKGSSNLTDSLPLVPGWPINIEGYSSNIVTADINNDTKDEVIYIVENKLHVVNGQGQELPGWPVVFNNPQTSDTCPPVIGDINGDGYKEIVLMPWANGYGSIGIYAYGLNGQLINGFPVIGRGYDYAPALYNMDNSIDGSLEIITRDIFHIFITYGNGVLMKSFIIDPDLFNYNITGIWNAPFHMAVGDINNDGLGEIVLIDDTGLDSYPRKIYAFNREGIQPSGWPVLTDTTGPFIKYPVLADVNGDNKLEVFASDWYDALYAINAYGQKIPAWNTMVNGGRGGWISVGYLGNGGALDLANGSYGYGLNAIRGMDGFKLFENLSLMGHINWGSILIGDFDGNQQKEIITYSDNVLHFYSGLDGHEISSFIVGSYTPFIENYPPAVGDINGDGKAEIICAAYGTNKLYAFVLANSDIDSWDWPMVSHDPERTGNFNNYLVTRYAISGSIKDSSGVGVGGVQLKDANNNLLAETNANGEYGFLMPSGWSGTVTPSKTNYNFTPPNKSYNNLNSNQTNQDYVANLNTYTVSGLVKRSNMGVSGVAIKEGNATLATTDQNGYYSFTKSFGWTGTVYPEKPSYSFSPQSRSYVNLSENKQNQNYEASLNTYAVSGFIKDLSGIGVAGVKIIEDAIKTTSSNTNQYEDEDNLEKINLAANQQSSILAVTDSNGYYSFTKPSGWTGTVHPEKTGYTFTPQSRSYINLTSNQTNQDYVATLKTFSIQGSIFLNNAGLAGVQLIEKSTLTVLTTTNQFGTYSFTKPFGWSGTVVPYKDGYVFDPVARNYNNINSNQLNQNYHTSVALAISGYVRNNTNIGIGGVVMQVTSPVYSPPMEVKTDSKGFYQIWVPMGWSGRVTPTSFTYVFSPPYSDYVNLTTNASQDYIGT